MTAPLSGGEAMVGETTRQRYLDAVVEHMMAMGRTDLPLVVLAEAAGTSDRMLVYYFKTREALLTEAVATIRARRRQKLANALARVSRASDPEAALADVLRWMASPDDNASVRFVLDAAGRGFHGEAPFDSFVAGSIRDGVEEATLAARRMGADPEAALNFATMFFGLGSSFATDLLATGDTERVENAIRCAVPGLMNSLALPSRL